MMDDKARFTRLPAQPRALGYYIAGRWHGQEGRECLARVAPGYGVEVSRVTLCTAGDVNRAVEAARSVFGAGHWSRATGAERAGVLLRAANGIRCGKWRGKSSRR